LIILSGAVAAPRNWKKKSSESVQTSTMVKKVLRNKDARSCSK